MKTAKQNCSRCELRQAAGSALVVSKGLRHTVTFPVAGLKLRLYLCPMDVKAYRDAGKEVVRA